MTKLKNLQTIKNILIILIMFMLELLLENHMHII